MRYRHPDDILLDISSRSLERILQTLAEAPEILTSPELSSKVSNALGFYKEMRLHYENVLGQLEDLEKAHLVPSEDSPDQIQRQLLGKITAYQEMRLQEADENEIYRQTQQDGLSRIQTLKALRSVFEFSLEEAKKVVDVPEIGRPDIEL